MKVKLEDIINNTGNIQMLQQEKLPVKISYRISRLANKLNPDVELFNTKRNDLIKELGEKEDGKDTYSVKDPEKLKEFRAKEKELLQEEIEIDWFEKIKVDDLGDIKIEASKLVPFMFE